MKQIPFDQSTQENIDQWLDGPIDEESKEEIRRLLQDDPRALEDAFYRTLRFGTGGLRALMGVGPNRLNIYTVRMMTQGVAQYLRRVYQDQKIAVCIAYDSRHHSKHFAQETAHVFACNGIEVYLFEELRPVPLLAFTCRYKECQAGIMVTASHNPPEYNGYKVYWGDGGQVLPPHDTGIMEEIDRIQGFSAVCNQEEKASIHHLGAEIDEAYLQTLSSLQHCPEQNRQKGASLNVVYTSLHGAGITLVPALLRDWGFTQLEIVEEQQKPNGAFPTVKSPNPEDAKALALGIQRLQDSQADLLLGTDPDTDRVGVVVRHQGEPVFLTGNQIACLCVAHVCEKTQEKGAFIKTIVTTEMFRDIVEAQGGVCYDVLTGFKYIGERITQWEKEGGPHFLFGGEESYGYLLGTHCRDKDGVISCALVCEVALEAKQQGMSLVDRMHALYDQYGIYREKLVSIKFPDTREGMEQIHKMMERLRQYPPEKIHNIAVRKREDFLAGALGLPRSNVLRFWLEEGTKLTIRPSGTEPKVKVYVEVVQKEFLEREKAIQICDQKIESLIESIQQLLVEPTP